jgi:hypothetical protein
MLNTSWAKREKGQEGIFMVLERKRKRGRDKDSER